MPRKGLTHARTGTGDVLTDILQRHAPYSVPCTVPQVPVCRFCTTSRMEMETLLQIRQ